MPSERFVRACAHLLLDWLNARFDASFTSLEPRNDAFIASDGAHSVGLFVAPLWEEDPSWSERLRAQEALLDAGGIDGSFLLWVPPRAGLPVQEPAASAWVHRVLDAAATLAPGDRTEVAFPVVIKMGKSREEGGYASVSGGLSRWWTRITESVQGTFSVDSTAVHRITHDGDARERLWQSIGEIARDVAVGQAVEFEIDEAWTLQRLANGAPRGFALAGAPPAIDPTDGILVRRAARKRLQQANEGLAPLDVDLRAVGLVGAYEFAELEGASATVKALDPGLYARLEAVCVLTDGDVRPTFLPRSLPWQM
jgi:hypothetical protein